EAMGDKFNAVGRYQLETADYLNTYYGRLALERLAKLGAEPAQSRLIFVSAELKGRDDEGDLFPDNAETIRTLLALGLYDPALKELEFAQRNYGESPAVQATIAWTNRQKAGSEKGTAQFNLARGSMNLMKRA